MKTPTFARTMVLASPAALLLCAGSAFGQGATCPDATVVQQSSNATPNTYTGTTLGATVTPVRGSCGSASMSPSVWFKLTPTSTGSIVISTCGSSTASGLDTVLSVHSACPTGNTTTGAGNIIASGCNDDGCSSNSSVTAFVTSGSTYWIRVAGYGNGVGTSGPFTLNVGQVTAAPPPPPPPPPATNGPDVGVYAITDIMRGVVGNITGYAVGTTSYNVGDRPVDWRDEGVNNKAPVIAQNVYKLKNGRFLHLGQAWLKHGFVSTNSTVGDLPTACQQPPLGGNQLGINCTDTYGAGLNGNQSNQGPRSPVNATTGYYPPVTNSFSSGNAINKQAQIPTSMLEPSSATVKYFGEGYYVTYDDATWGNGLNSLSYTPLTLNTVTSTPNVGTTVRQQPAINAWRAFDPSVVLSNADHPFVLTAFGQQGDASTAYPVLPRNITCRYIVAAKVTDNGNGTWHYEYAVYNHNSDRSGYSLSVPLPITANVTNRGFWFPFTHSGEPYTNQPWTTNTQGQMLNATGQVISEVPGAWTWDVVPGKVTVRADANYDTNPNANAIRWGTMYTFWFDADVAPTTGKATIALFKPPYSGSHPSAAAPAGRTADDLASAAIAGGLPVPQSCVADVAALGGAVGADGQLSADDIVVYLTNFFADNLVVADLASLGGAGTPDGAITSDDLVYFLSAFFTSPLCQ